MPSAGQQLLQLRSRLGGGRKNSGGGGNNNDGADASAEADSPNAALAAEVSSYAAASAAAAAAAVASSGAADALDEPRAASPRKGISPISPSLDLAAAFKPSQSLASRRKVGRRRHKSGKKGSKSSFKGDAEHHSPTKKGSGRRMRPGRGIQAGPGKEGRRSRRNKREQQSNGRDADAHQPIGSASGEASDSFATTTAGEHYHAAAHSAPAAGIFVTKMAGEEAVEAAFLPPPIGLDRYRTYSHSDHDTLLTGSGTLTTAVSTRQATVEGMSHQDALEHFDVQTNQSSEIASLGGGSTGHAGYGRVGFAKLEELPSVVAGANDGTDAIVADGKTPTLSIHTFPCTRGRSLEAPAPFDERGADAMTRYRQHDEDEYLTDESSEVPVVPLHWPKARRPGEERDFEGLAVVSADADLFDADDDDDDDDDNELQIKVEALPTTHDDSGIEEEEEEDTDGDLPTTGDTQEEVSTSIAIAAEGVAGPATAPAPAPGMAHNNKRDHQYHQHEEEVTGEEIEVEVQESTIGITATAPAASSTSNEKVVVEELSVPTATDTEPSPAPTFPVAVNTTKVTQASMSNASENKRPPRSASTEPPKASASRSSGTIRRTSSVTFPFGASISQAVAGEKTPTDHAFSSAIVTPERRRMESNICELDTATTAVGAEPNDDDDHSTASDQECNSSVEVIKGDDDVEEEERVDGEEKKEEASSVIAKVPSNDDSESTPSGLVPFSPPLPTRASSFPNLQAARTASFSALPNLPNPIPFVRQAESFGARSNMSIGSNSSSAWKSWPTPADPVVPAAQSAPASSSSVQIPSSILAGNDSEDESDCKDNLPPPIVCSIEKGCEEKDDVAVEENAQNAASGVESDDDDDDDDDDTDNDNVDFIEGSAQKLRASPDGSASTVRIRTFDASKPPNMVEEVTAVEPKSSSGADEEVPPIPAVASISFPTNRYLNPKLDDGKLYSEHPHDEAPSPLQSPKDDIFRPSAENGGEESGRSEFPKIAHSSSSGSHSLPAVLSPAYKFEPIENDYYFASESESCSGEDESNYESSPDCLNRSNDESEEGTNEQVEVDDRKPSPNIEQNKVDDSQHDDVQSSRYESFARSGVNLMRNLTQHDDSTASSIVAEAAAAATAAVSGRQQPSERSSKEGAKKKNDDFTFSLSDIPSMLSRCIGDIGIGEYYDTSASAFQPEKEMEKKK